MSVGACVCVAVGVEVGACAGAVVRLNSAPALATTSALRSACNSVPALALSRHGRRPLRRSLRICQRRRGSRCMRWRRRRVGTLRSKTQRFPCGSMLSTSRPGSPVVLSHLYLAFEVTNVASTCGVLHFHRVLEPGDIEVACNSERHENHASQRPSRWPRRRSCTQPHAHHQSPRRWRA